jgi:hypothetical protein
MSTDQPTPSARRTVDWGLLGMRAIFVAFTVTVSALSLMQYGTSPAWVATTVLVPVAATIALDMTRELPPEADGPTPPPADTRSQERSPRTNPSTVSALLGSTRESKCCAKPPGRLR